MGRLDLGGLMPVTPMDKSDYEIRLELDISPAEFYGDDSLSWLAPSEEDVIEAQCMSYYLNLDEEE